MLDQILRDISLAYANMQDAKHNLAHDVITQDEYDDIVSSYEYMCDLLEDYYHV